MINLQNLVKEGLIKMGKDYRDQIRIWKERGFSDAQITEMLDAEAEGRFRANKIIADAVFGL